MKKIKETCTIIYITEKLSSYQILINIPQTFTYMIVWNLNTFFSRNCCDISWLSIPEYFQDIGKTPQDWDEKTQVLAPTLYCVAWMSPFIPNFLNVFICKNQR